MPSVKKPFQVAHIPNDCLPLYTLFVIWFLIFIDDGIANCDDASIVLQALSAFVLP